LPAEEPTPASSAGAASPADAALLASLREELFFSPGGGIPTACEDEFWQYAAPPHFWVSQLGTGFFDIAFLCVFGLPLDEPIDLAIYGPNQAYLSSLSFRAYDLEGAGFAPYELRSSAGEIVGSAWEIDQNGLLELYIWDTAIIPTGQWRIVAQSDTVSIDDFVDAFVTSPFVSVGPDVVYDPFYGDGSFPRLLPGDIVVVSGTGFASQQSIALGIYFIGGEYTHDERGTLIDSLLVTTDSSGNFVLRLPLAAGMETGLYSVLTSEDNWDPALDRVVFDPTRSFVITE
jgi:hypothetical protein